jgi:hypothetical protein
MIRDHHEWVAGIATMLLTAVDGILGAHRVKFRGVTAGYRAELDPGRLQQA